MTSDFGVAFRKILQLEGIVRHHTFAIGGPTHHSSSSTLKVLALENILSYAPIRVMIISTGLNLDNVYQDNTGPR